ncbi:glycosyltransferase family 87 protein [Sphingomonas parapaucimobilis]|uniref:glycosyltransferase family 87 protein n=1 Tax=Sphingomonas parapaucimobilis TaxID=28213 RepID=UPI00321AE099
MDARPASPLLLPAPIIWVFGSLIVLMLFILDVKSAHHGMIGLSEMWGRDFANVWTGGTLALNGQLDILYDIERYRGAEHALYGTIGSHNYSYPPIALFLDIPFALLPYHAALLLWLAGTGALFALAARPWLPEGGMRWLLLLTPAALMNIWAGHFGFLIGALFLAGWHWLPERPRRAGVCFGLMALKPHVAVLVPIILLLRGDWRTVATAALTVGLLVLFSTLAFGPDLWTRYLTVTSGVQARMIDPGQEFYGLMATSLASALLRQHVPAAIAYGLQGMAMVGIAIGVMVATVRGAPPAALALLAATGTFVLLPYAFNYDLTVVMLAALVAYGRPDASPMEKAVALTAFLTPQWGMVASAIGVPLTPIALIALFAVELRQQISRGRDVPAGAGAARSA